MPRRVAITGIGPVTAIGIGREAFEAALRRGDGGIAEVTGFEVADDGPLLVAEVMDLDIKQYLRSTKAYLDRNSELAFAACELAIRDAGLLLDGIDHERFGLCVGTEWGNLHTVAAFRDSLVTKGPRLVPPFLFPHAYPNTTNSLLSIEYDVQGFNFNFAGSGCSGAEAVAYAFEAVASGRAEVMVAGGVDALCAELFAAYAGAGELSPLQGQEDGKLGAEGCRPFDPQRNGIVLGEGAAFFVLEAQEHAVARGARPLAWLLAASRAGDSGRAMRAVLDALPDRAPPVAAFASANGSVREDGHEAAALLAVFDGATPPVTAVKSLCGETLAAAGPISLAAAIAALAHEEVPATGGTKACAFRGLDLCLAPRSLAERPGSKHKLYEVDARRALIHAADSSGAAVAFVIQS